MNCCEECVHSTWHIREGKCPRTQTDRFRGSNTTVHASKDEIKPTGLSLSACSLQITQTLRPSTGMISGRSIIKVTEILHYISQGTGTRRDWDD
jgi:hypothetical protein